MKFIKKWFFPPTFSYIFYPCFIGFWFFGIYEWNRTWENFLNYTVGMLAIFSIFYLAVDELFPKFHYWIKEQNKWVQRLVMTITIIIWFTLIALSFQYFPVDN